VKKFHGLKLNNEYLFAFVANMAFMFWWSWPVSLRFSSAIDGNHGDATGSIYDMWTLIRNSKGPLSSFTNQLIGYPFGVNVNGSSGFSAFSIQYPAKWIAQLSNEVVSYNIVMSIGLVLPGFLMYVALRRRGHLVLTACIGGMAFTLFPFHLVAATSWTTLAQTWWLPVAIIVLDNFRKEPRCGSVVWLFLVVLGSSTTNGYIGLMVIVLTGTVLIHDFLFVVSVRQWAIAHLQRKTGIATIALTSAASLVLIPKVVGVMRDSVSRDPAELKVWGLRLNELLQPGPLRKFFPHLYDRLVIGPGHGSNLAEQSQFIGYSVLAFLLVGIFVSLAHRQILRLSREILVLVMGLWFAMSQGIIFLGSHLPIPGRILMELAPVWRVYSRFGLLIMLASVCLSAVGLDWIFRRVNHLPVRVLVFTAIATWTAIDLTIHVPGSHVHFIPPAYVKELDKVSGAVAFYPLSGVDEVLMYERRFWQREHGLPMINGDHKTDLQLRAEGLDDHRIEGLGAKLADLGVRWVIIHRSKLPVDVLDTPSDSSLTEVWRDNEYTLYHNHAKENGGVARFVSGSFGLEGVGSPAQGEWLGPTAELEIVGKFNACLAVDIRVAPHKNQRPLEFKLDGRWVPIVGQQRMHVRLSGRRQQVEVRSPSGALDLDGLDSRKVSSFVSILAVEATSDCPPQQ
jgi:hypothetical protein